MKTRVWGTGAKGHYNVRIQPDLVEDAHKFAFIAGVTLSEYFRVALREKVERDKAEDERIVAAKEQERAQMLYQRPR